jgi:hypothetical protein
LPRMPAPPELGMASGDPEPQLPPESPEGTDTEAA